MKAITNFLFLSFTVLFIWVHSLQAADVDTVRVQSPSMDKEIKALVITPENYADGEEFPVVYLLHGAMANYTELLKQEPALREYADLHNFIIVCPDGNVISWYFDSPVNPDSRYETHISSELVTWIDKNYNTIQEPAGRAISGVSMGGHGALYIAFKHQDVFGAAGSMSGGVDIRPFADKFGISQQLGAYAENREYWERNTVINMLHLLTPGSLALVIDCGTEDFFFEVNKNLHEKLRARNIPHEYISRPGAHDYDYFRKAVKYQLLFMKSFFDRTL